VSIFKPLPPAPAGDRRPLHLQQLRFKVVSVRRAVGQGRNIAWYVVDRQPFWDDFAINHPAGAAPQHAFPTRRAAVNWIADYLLTHRDHFEQLRAVEYDRRRSRAEQQRDAELDDDALATDNPDNKGEQQ
jgi:hypothetical protein